MDKTHLLLLGSSCIYYMEMNGIESVFNYIISYSLQQKQSAGSQTLATGTDSALFIYKTSFSRQMWEVHVAVLS